MKVIIVGGSAGGATAATRLRRLDEHAQIILVDRSAHVSYSNCSMPYYIGGLIKEKTALSVQTPESLHTYMKLDVRTLQEVTAINRADKRVTLRHVDSGETYEESYDILLLSPGASPVLPPVEGGDSARLFTIRTLSDIYALDDFLTHSHPKDAVVIGGGYIGLEMAENLATRGLDITVLEGNAHILPILDIDMAKDAEYYLRCRGIKLFTQNRAERIVPEGDRLLVHTQQGILSADFVLSTIGVTPNTAIAKAAGLALAPNGEILVDDHTRTSDPFIYAIGDAVQTTNPLTGDAAPFHLAGPANRQARIAADNIAGGDSRYIGTLGTAIMKLFDMTIGSVGMTESALKARNLPYDKVYLSPPSHTTNYPGALPISIKALFETPGGRLLGAQLIGMDGVDKRIDLLAVAITHNMTAADLANMELAYAPPYSSAKSILNLIGYAIEDVLDGKVRQIHWHDVDAHRQEGMVFIDIRPALKYTQGHLPDAINLPLHQLREQLSSLDASKTYCMYCQSGVASYNAARILTQEGFDAVHLAGGYRLYISATTGFSQLFGCAHPAYM